MDCYLTDDRQRTGDQHQLMVDLWNQGFSD